MDYSKKGYGQRPMWQWVVIYLLIGGLVYAAIYYAFLQSKGGNASPTAYTTPTSTTSQLKIVAKSTGFEPQTITIKAGQTVTWTNQSGTKVFVASSPHPTHTDYPPLNLGVIENGGTKFLSFPTPGTYKYHNHLNPGQYGSITVE